MNETPNNQNKYITSPSGRRPGGSIDSQSERLGICSIVAGGVGVLFACCCFPSGLICAAVGIVLAIMSKKADTREKKGFNTHAIIGLVLCAVAILLTFLACYMMIVYYSVLRNPSQYPELNDFVRQVEEMMNYLYELYGTTP